MKDKEAVLYVQLNGRFMEDAPNKPYFVRFPNPSASKVLFAADTRELVIKLLAYTRTAEGKAKDKAGAWRQYIKPLDNDQEGDDDV